MRNNRKDAASGIQARALVAAITALVFLLMPGAPSSESAKAAIKVTSEPAGARIWIDGVLRGTAPALLEVAAGRRSLRVEHPGFRATTRKIKVVSGRLHTLHVKLESAVEGAPGPAEGARSKPPAPGPSAVVKNLADPGDDAPPGTVAITTTPPGLHVFMNEELIPQPTPVLFEIRPGIYEMRIEDQGETVFLRTIFVRPGVVNDFDLIVRKVRRLDYGDPWQ